MTAKTRDIILSDTTLRDGEQMPGASLVPDDKVAIARALADAGFTSIEAGFPACAQSEIEAIRKIVREVRGPVISALARALPQDIDAAYDALKEAPPEKRCVNLFVATSPVHRESKLNKSKEQLLDLIGSAIQYARKKFDIVSFGPEDASRTEPEFLCAVYRTAIEAGARVIAFTDTLGVLTPEKVGATIRHIRENVPVGDKTYIAVHFHNDLGLATANSLAAIAEGVDIVQGTINGIGERAGNTALEEVVLALELNSDQYGCRHPINTKKLTALSRLVAQKTGIPLSPNKAIVGSNIFATEAGIHQDGILKNPDTYLPFRPELVGGDAVKLVLGKHSGRAAVEHRLKELGHELSADQINRVVEAVKSIGKK